MTQPDNASPFYADNAKILSEPSFDETAIRSHLSILHERAAGIRGVLVVSVYYADPDHSAEERPGVVTHHKIGEVDGMVHSIMAHSETPNANVYVGLQVMRPSLARGARGGVADIVALIGLVADLDADTGKAGDLPCEASFTIETSPGNRQPVLLFSDPISPAEAKPLAAALRRATGSDAGTSDIAHVWRVPGTLNRPGHAKIARGRSREPFPVTLAEPFYGLLYEAGALDATLAPWARAETASGPSAKASGEPRDAAALYARLSALGVEKLEADPEPGERSEHAARVYEQLSFEGFDLDDALALVREYGATWKARYKTDAAMVADAERLWAKFAHHAEILDAANDNEPPAPLPTSSVALDDLTHPGGLVEDLIDWICSSADHPSRPLALAAVLPFVGALIGRRFTGPTDLRSNLYVVALAESGYGKEHARSALKRLITAANLDHVSGPARLMSASGLRDAIMYKPSSVCMIDEFGGLLRQINDPKAGIHNALIRNDLLEVHSSAATYYDGAAYARTPAVKVHNPNLCIYGTSTPTEFWRALNSFNTTDGLLARFLLFDLSNIPLPEVAATSGVDVVPPKLVAACKKIALAGRAPGALNIGACDVGETPFAAAKVPWDADTELTWRAFRASCKQAGAAATAEARPILNRAAEHAIKLALIVAVAGNPARPRITSAEVSWAIDLAWHSTCKLIAETRDRIGDNQREIDKNKILGMVKDAKDAGITEGVIADRTGGIKKRDREEIISDLQFSGRIEKRRVQGKMGRPSERLYYVR